MYANETNLVRVPSRSFAADSSVISLANNQSSISSPS
jgi:hypothetical protein